MFFQSEKFSFKPQPKLTSKDKIFLRFKKLKSQIPIKEINSHPEIFYALENNKKIRFNFLSPTKATLTNIAYSHYDDKQKIIEDLNSFGEKYLNYNKNSKFSSQYMEDLIKENSLFIKNYHLIEEKQKQNKEQNNKDMFIELKKQYEKQGYKLNDLNEKENKLFSSDLLLSGDKKEKLEKYIKFQKDFGEDNRNAIMYLNNINKKVIKQTTKKRLSLDFMRENEISKKIKDVKSFKFLHELSKKKLKEIKKSKEEIKNLNKIINSMDEIDFFFKSDNKNYFEKLKISEKRQNSTKDSSMGIDNLLSPLDSNILFKRNFVNNNDNKNRIKNTQQRNYNHLKKINKLQNKSPLNSSNDFNASSISLFEEKKTILNHTNNLGNNTKTTNFNISTIFNDSKNLRNNFFSKSRNSTVNVNRNFTTLNNKIKFGKTRNSVYHRKKNISLNMNKKLSTEELYEQIKLQSENQFEKNRDNIKLHLKIKNYLINKRYKFSPANNLFFTLKRIDRIRGKLNDNNYIDKEIHLREITRNKNYRENIKRININHSLFKKNIANEEDKMIKFYASFDDNNINYLI